jgi:hypothetical protein
VDIQYRCRALKDIVAVDLRERLDARERGEILIAALYEMSRSVLPELGPPRKSREYQEAQAAVLELISFIAMPLMRGSAEDGRGVAVLAEVAEGCLDPLLKKKFSVYAQQLLAKSRPGGHDAHHGRPAWLPWLLGLAGSVALLALYLGWPEAPLPVKPQGVRMATMAPTPASRVPQEASPGVGFPPQLAPPAGQVASPVPAAEVATEFPTPILSIRGAASLAEQTTRVRIINNQILVPVTLRNAGETVRIELVLDTGATRTSVHEELASRLRVDLRQVRFFQSELADGKLVRSYSASVDSLGVGPFTMAPAELGFIPYQGSDGLHDGLLGMDFLGKHRYQIEMEHELIRWF